MKQVKTLSFAGQDIYCGIDVHKNDSIKGFGVRDETTSGTLENLGMPDKSLKEVD